MADTPFDMRDILLEATADVQQLVREVIAELSQPRDQEEVHAMWQSMPDEHKEMFAMQNPDEYRAMMEAMKGR